MIEIREFGAVPHGKVYLAKITNSKGESAEILNLGATLRALYINDKDGQKRDVVLGYDDPATYLNCSGYLGATVGRYANRIDGPAFEINGVKYPLFDTSGKNVALHGGVHGFNKKLFEISTAENSLFARKGGAIKLPENGDVLTLEGNALRFSMFSPDMEEGFPGNLFMTVEISFTDDSRIRLSYEATCDRDTVFNVTNHSYFALSGQDCGHDCLHTELKINASAITATDDRSVPNGNFIDVTSTAFDFRTAKAIGRDIGDDHIQIQYSRGYDHNFVLDDYRPGHLRDVVTAYDPKSGIRLTGATDLPGMQLYTANYLTERPGKNGATYHERSAFCLETQKYPDTPNHPNFPSALLKCGEQYKTVTEYKFN